jgi:hypothetical protein
VWHLSSFFTWTLGPVHIRGLGSLYHVPLDQHTGFAEVLCLRTEMRLTQIQTIILRWINQLHGFFLISALGLWGQGVYSPNGLRIGWFGWGSSCLWHTLHSRMQLWRIFPSVYS